MYPTLFHIYGPLAINSYGVAILIGVLIFLWRMILSPRRKGLISKDQLISLTIYNVFVAVFSGRIVHVLSTWHTFHSWKDIFALWDGGFSVLGSLLGVILFTVCYLKSNKIPTLPVLDLAALYAPIMQGFGRLGCFFAGCCYGIETVVPWGITFTNPDTLAPLCIRLHPTQLYSAVGLFLIFLIIRFGLSKHCKYPGQIAMLYLIFTNAERFLIDFWRGDRILGVHNFSPLAVHFFSFHQWIALIIMLLSLLGLLMVSSDGKKTAFFKI